MRARGFPHLVRAAPESELDRDVGDGEGEGDAFGERSLGRDGEDVEWGGVVGGDDKKWEEDFDGEGCEEGEERVGMGSRFPGTRFGARFLLLGVRVCPNVS